MHSIRLSVVALAAWAGLVSGPALHAQETGWQMSEPLKPCFIAEEGEGGVDRALAKCRELLGSARYGGEDAAMIRYAIIDYQSRTATIDEQIEQLTLLTRESLPQSARYDRDVWLAGLCQSAKRWQCVFDALEPELVSSRITVEAIDTFTQALIELRGAAGATAYGDKMIAGGDRSAVSLLIRAKGKLGGGDKAGAAADLVAAGDALPEQAYRAHNTICWQLVTEAWAATSARKYCDNAAAGSPLDWATWDSHGAMNLALGDFAKAWQDYEQAVRLDEKAWHALYGRGLALEGLGRADEGASDKRRALEQDKTIKDLYTGYGLEEQRRSPAPRVTPTVLPAQTAQRPTTTQATTQPKQSAQPAASTTANPAAPGRPAASAVAESPRPAAAPAASAPAPMSEREQELRAYLAKLPQVQFGRTVTIEKGNSKRVPHGLWGSKFDDYEYEVRLAGKKGERYRFSLSSVRNGEIPSFAFGGSLKAPLLRVDATLVDSATKQGRSAFAKYSTDFIIFEIPETGDYVLTLSQSGTVTKSSEGTVGGMSPQGNKNPDPYQLKVVRVR